MHNELVFVFMNENATVPGCVGVFVLLSLTPSNKAPTALNCLHVQQENTQEKIHLNHLQNINEQFSLKIRTIHTEN